MHHPKVISVPASGPGQVDAMAITGFLTALDNDFSPPLSARTDLAQYAQKLVDRGRILTIEQDGDLVALAAIYCNDHRSQRAYLSFLGVKSSARSDGLGSTLMHEAIRTARDAGMLTLELQTDGDRPELLRFYRRFGFDVMESYARYGGFQAHRLRKTMLSVERAVQPERPAWTSLVTGKSWSGLPSLPELPT